MRGLKYLLLPLILTVNACTSDYFLLQPNDNRIQEWVQQEYYSYAIKALRNKPQSPYVKSQLQEVIQKAHTYDAKQATKIRGLYNAGEWRESFRQLNIALRHYPDGTQIKLVEALLKKKQKEYNGRLRAQFLLAKAQWLLQARKLLHEMQLIEPGRNLTTEIEKISWDIMNTADELYQLGTMAMKQGDIDLAYNCLSLSDRLHPAGKTTTAIARLDQIQFAEKQKKIQQAKLAKEKQEQKKVELTHKKFLDLSKHLSEALVKGDLPRAEKLLHQMKQLKVKPERIKELQAALDAAIKAKVDALMLRGNQLYKNGKIEQARKAWLEALKLQPGNKQLKQNIARAEKVLKRLRELKSKEPKKAPQQPTR